jgi:hypothetical protein
MRLHLILILIVALGAAGCYDSPPSEEEDYDDFHEVYSGLGPDLDGEDLLFKLNFDIWGDIEGEAEGPFFSQVDGRFVDGPAGTFVTLEARFRSNGCEGVTDVAFEGVVKEGQLTGQMFYKGCTVYDFYYEGELVGGVGR